MQKLKQKVTKLLKVNKNYFASSFLLFPLHVCFPKHRIQRPNSCLDWRSLVGKDELFRFLFILI